MPQAELSWVHPAAALRIAGLDCCLREPRVDVKVGTSTPEEQQQTSMYLHGLIVRRKYSGLGTEVIEWARKRAGELGNNWDGIDVSTDNLGLHRYDEQRGFRHVRTLDDPSGLCSSARPLIGVSLSPTRQSPS
jgi:hypothetical protein